MKMSFAPSISVTVFGGATVDRIAMTRETPVAGASNPGTVATAPGGVGFNVAIALARLGAKVRFVSRVGDDPEGRHIVEAAGSAGVDTCHITRSTDQPTASYIAAFDQSGSLVIGIAATDINDEMTPATIADAASATPAGDFWVIDANFPTETLAYLLGEARRTGHPVAAMAVSPAKAIRFKTLLDEITLFFANRIEATALLGRPTGENLTAAELARRLAKRSPRAGLVITDADRPLAAASGGRVDTIAPLPVKVRSVNGAGDALAAATIYARALNRPFLDSVRYGLAAAAITVESAATIPSCLTAAAVAGRLGAHAKHDAS